MHSDAPAHTTTFVRLQGRVRPDGKSVDYDLGAFAQALVCYDTVIVETSHDSQLAQIIEFFDRSDDLPGLFSVLAGRQLKLLNYEYLPVVANVGRWISGVRLVKPAATASGRTLYNDFVPKVLDGRLVRDAFRGRRKQLADLRALAADAAMDEGLDYVPPVFRNAEADFFDRERCVLRLLQEIEHDPLFAGIPELLDTQALVRQNISRRGELVYEIEWILTPRTRLELSSRMIELPRPERVLNKVVTAVQTVDTASRLGSDIWPSQEDVSGVADKVYEISRLSRRI